MILHTKEEFIKSERNSPIPHLCDYCNVLYTKSKEKVIFSKTTALGKHYELWKWPITTKTFCSRVCFNKSKVTGQWENCKQCNKEIYIKAYLLKQKRSHFCSQTCAATYNNSHKTYGTRRSKLECWLADQLTLKYPNLEIHFNRKDAINSELDFYFPLLKLAFELNGIFHYEPIYGNDTLFKTQNNDSRKFQACIERGIELCIIDSSGQKYFKTETSQKYLDIITNLVNNKLSKLDYVEVL